MEGKKPYVPKEAPKFVGKKQSESSNNLHNKSSHNLPVNNQDKPKPFTKMDRIRKKIIGFTTHYMSPFNIELQTIYVDHTATNRAYKSVEDMIELAKKSAANPHTEFSHFGKYSTDMMHYAQDSLLRSFSASKEDFVALPAGSGSTGAIEKAIKILKSLEKKEERPTIYLTPYEHHSNILPWVQFYDNVCELASDRAGNLLFDKIEKQLASAPTPNIIVSVSAASNVTSKITNLEKLNETIKKVRKSKNVILALDCAAYCCHHELNLEKNNQIDFVYLSPHKNLGGAESCGVLIARKNIVRNAKPTFPGGGTVAFVKGYSKEDIMYDVDIFNRQIAGTPPFFGFYRAALSYELLKNQIGYDLIHEREKQNTELFMSLIKEGNQLFKEANQKKYIMIYGDSDFDMRANVITLNILQYGKIVHHNFASLIFADIFGIQLRSGCFCAGPFGMKLLKLDEKKVQMIEEEVSVGIFRSKPGYMRLDLAFYLQPYQIEYLARAIIGVAENYKNMELIYTISADGEIQRHKSFKNVVNDMFSLDHSEEAKNIVYADKKQDNNRLSERHKTLAKQLERGLQIIRHPVKFLKSQQK